MKKILFCINLSLLLVLAVLESASADVLIITNPDVNETSLTKRDIEEIFLGKKGQWQDISKIRPVLMDEVEVLKEFLEIYVNKTQNQYINHWKRMLFTGKGKPPIRFKSSAEVVAYVSETAGAIGFVPAGTSVENVNTINVR